MLKNHWKTLKIAKLMISSISEDRAAVLNEFSSLSEKRNYNNSNFLYI